MSAKRGKGRGRGRPKAMTIDALSEGTALLPGRRQCCCEASKHELVANCLSCGRIVCSQEGSGVCMTCGHMVWTREQRQSGVVQHIETGVRLSSNTSNAGLKDIVANTFESNSGLETAVRHKDQMLEFDRNSSVRTKVIDDENDYFSLGSQNWISNEKRKTISSKVNQLNENKLKKNQKILIDLIQKSATDYSEPVVKDFEQQIQDLHKQSELKTDYQTVNASEFISEDNEQKRLPTLKYTNNDYKMKDNLTQDLIITKKLIKSYNGLKLQDKELMTMSDQGMCLSVGQPFASLLVCGVKRFEGRNWYSSFRGRLWIQSNARTPKDVEKIEQFYGFAGIKTFPDSYPTSALVGCVTVIDCLPLEEFRDLFPEGEIDDNYIFVCEEPKQLPTPLPALSSGHKIFKMNEKSHFMAKKSLKL